MNLTTKKILVVGAGGIGCELLKNVALTGCKDIYLIDLDTIEYSNLNRQFLFHRQHVGKPKAQVAAETVMTFCPEASIKWFHKSVMEPEFDVTFFKQFSFVLNALDNRAARNHVNRLCLAADVYLIESGTSGYLGQTTVIKKGVTECYECTPKPVTQKTYPACTIRNTPSEPIHCIIWAKHLFNQLFGEVDPDEDVSPDLNDDELAVTSDDSIVNSSNNKTQNGSVQSNKPETTVNGVNHASDTVDHQRLSTRKWAVENRYNSKMLFNKLFHDDIVYLLSMSNLWKKRTPPKPLNLDDDYWNEGTSQDLIDCVEDSNFDSSNIDDQKIWPLYKCRSVFLESVERLKVKLDKSSDNVSLTWDKDDDLAMDFVASCSNLRCCIFNIARKSRFDIKSMAGNIVPAIATSNAIVAGLIVMEILNISSNRFNKCATTYLRHTPNHKGDYFSKEQLAVPNPKCYVCSEKSEVIVKLNVHQFTVRALEEKVLKQTLHMVAPDVEIDDNKGTIIISSERGEITGLDNQTLSSLAISDNTRLNCDDFKQHFELRLIINHSDISKNDEFELLTDTTDLHPLEDLPSTSKQALEDELDECVLIETSSILKRKLSTTDQDSPLKKIKIS